MFHNDGQSWIATTEAGSAGLAARRFGLAVARLQAHGIAMRLNSLAFAKLMLAFEKPTAARDIV